MLKGNAFEQVGIEIQALKEKGKIPDDYAERKYGFQSLGELLNFIDSEVPDADRLQAVKAMFYALNATDINGQELLRYQLFRLSMKLSGSQLVTLKMSYLIKDEFSKENGVIGVYVWLNKILEKIGHGVATLILQDEKILME